MPPKKESSKIINFYEKIPKHMLDNAENPNFHLHKFKLPFRACVVSPSGGGKTNWLLNLIHLFSQGKGTFSTITIITRNKDQPIYKFLESKCEQIKILEGLHQTPQLDKMDKSTNSLCVWDDLVLSKDLSIVENYYIRARKLNCSVIFISQDYHRIPTIVRRTCSYLILLKINGNRDLNAILRECGLGLTKVQLLKMYEFSTDVKFSPLIVDFEAEPNERFRKGFTCICLLYTSPSPRD